MNISVFLSYPKPCFGAQRAFIDHIKSVRPSTVKGNFIEGVSISPSMGPGVQVAVAE